jgi:hypothetical protein
MRVVELSRFCQFTLLGKRSRESSHVGKTGRKSETIEYLRDTSLLNVAVLVFAPITCTQRTFNASGNVFMPHSQMEVCLLLV